MNKRQKASEYTTGVMFWGYCWEVALNSVFLPYFISPFDLNKSVAAK